MIRSIRARLDLSERAQIFMIAALLLPVALGMSGLAVDVGIAAAARRNTQNAADSAALAGAGVLLKGGTVAQAQAAALSYANSNGYATSDVTIHIPPTAGAHIGDSQYVELVITRNRPTIFIKALGVKTFSAGARAVGGFNLTQKNYALVVLNKTMCSAYNQTSNSTLVIQGGGAIVNSSCQPSANQGGGSIVTADALDYYAAGSWLLANNATTSVAPAPVGAQIADPLASLARPVPCPQPPATVAGCIAASVDSGGTAANPGIAAPNGKNVTLHPGTYYGGLKIAGTGTVNFLPGTYIFAGGGFAYSSTATVTGTGVTLFNTGDSYATKVGDRPCVEMSITGSGSLNLSAPTSGTYKNILFWQDDSCTIAFKYSGTSHTTTGVIYLPKAQLNVSGGGNLGALQVIVDSFDYSGSNSITITYANYVPTSPPRLALVE